LEAVEFNRLSSLAREKLCRNIQNTELSSRTNVRDLRKISPCARNKDFSRRLSLSTVEGPEMTRENDTHFVDSDTVLRRRET